MEAQFKVSKSGEFGLLVEGLTGEADGYLSTESPVSHRVYKWEHSVTLNVLFALDSGGERTYVDRSIVKHIGEDDGYDVSKFDLKKDSLYEIVHMIIPTKEWLNYMISLGEIPGTTFKQYTDLYYYDEEDKQFYLSKRVGGIEESNELAVIEDLYKTQNKTSTTVVSDFGTVFRYPYLERCYHTLIKDLLQCVKSNSNCPSTELVIKERNRDLVLMFLSAIKFSVDLGNHFEAQRYLERLNKCNNICSDTQIYRKDNYCGC